VDHYAKAYPIFSRIRGYRRMQKMLNSLKKFEGSEVAKERIRIIEFYDNYGENATKEAFGADRKVISRWKRRLRENRGELSSLIPHSTRPHRMRRSEILLRLLNIYGG
jgi:transposase